jgi:hypothetical protein
MACTAGSTTSNIVSGRAMISLCAAASCSQAACTAYWSQVMMGLVGCCERCRGSAVRWPHQQYSREEKTKTVHMDDGDLAC